MVSSVASSRRGRRSGGKCENFSTGSTLCKGEELINQHGWRMTWWFTVVLVLVGIILISLLAGKMEDDATSPWNVLAVNTWISPTARSMGALVGIMLVFSAYTNYMLGWKKGHLDSFPAQYGLSTFLRVTLWIFFVYGLAYGGTIGSAFSLYTLAIIATWSVMTGHTSSPFHAWLTLLELVFIVFLIIWLSLTRAAMFPTP